MTFKVDTDIPIPPLQLKAHEIHDAVDTLEVGHSIFLTDERLVSAAQVRLNRLKDGRKLTRKKATENGVHGYRIWRIS